MHTKSRYSSVIVITFAEFAWLAFFGMLFVAADLRNKNEDLIKKLGILSAEKPQSTINRTSAYDELANRFSKLTAELIVVKHQNEKFKETNKDFHTQIQDKDTQLGIVSRKIQDLETINESLEKLLSESLESARSAPLKKQPLAVEQWRTNADFSVRMELLGIKVKRLRNVVFVLDCSSSMKSNNAENWKTAVKIMRDWLEFLPFQRVAIVSFNSTVTAFPNPENGSRYIEIREKADAAPLPNGLATAINHVESLETKPGTNTLNALACASKYNDADMVFLFTDGKPEFGVLKTTSRLQADILQFYKSDGKSPIFVVALGDHDEKNLRFLKQLSAAKENGGFIAR